MKRINTLLALFFALTAHAQQDSSVNLWKSKFYTIDSFKVEMSWFKDKPLVIVGINSANPNLEELTILDSLNRTANGKFGVVGLLLRDTLAPLSKTELLNRFRQNQGISFPITNISKLRKGLSSDDRHLLLKWLVEAPVNNHYKLAFPALNQVLVLNKKLALYAVLTGDALPDKPHWDEIINRGMLD